MFSWQKTKNLLLLWAIKKYKIHNKNLKLNIYIYIYIYILSIGIQKKASLKPYNEKNTDLQKKIKKN